MFILVNTDNNMIVGTVNGNVNEAELMSRKVRVYEIDDADFDPSMIGSILAGFDNVMEEGEVLLEEQRR